jgi:hypothetical protein
VEPQIPDPNISPGQLRGLDVVSLTIETCSALDRRWQLIGYHDEGTCRPTSHPRPGCLRGCRRFPLTTAAPSSRNNAAERPGGVHTVGTTKGMRLGWRVPSRSGFVLR